MRGMPVAHELAAERLGTGMQKNETLTVRQAAEWCGVSVRTALNWIERGDLKSYKLPGRGDNRIQMRDFINFLTRFKMPIPGDVLDSAPRVLVIDEDSRITSAIAEAFNAQGWETRVAHEGFSAGALLGSFRPDLVTLGLKLSGLNGLQMIQLMRRTEMYQHIKILVVSSMPPEHIQQARSAGADDVLSKPIDHRLLQGKAAALLGRQMLSGKPSHGDQE